MRVFNRLNISRAVLMLTMLAAVPATTQAQTDDAQWARWWYGIFGGANINLFSGSLRNLNATPDAGVGPFTAGTGLGLVLGGILEYNSGDLLGGNLMVSYDNRSVTFDQANTTEPLTIPNSRQNEDLTTSLAYVSIEPNLRLNLGSRFFHLLIGPSFKINVAKGYTYAFDDGNTALQRTTHENDLNEVRSFVIGGQAGLGYDIPLTDASANTQMLLTPFAQFHLSQQLMDPADGSPNEFKVNTIRAGVELKFGSRPVAAPPPDITSPVGEFSVRAPGVVTDSRRLNETFPIRNYIFFDAGSTEIPARYVKLSKGDAGSFREEQLVKPTAGTGNEEGMAVRSRRQMEVYYNVMNVFADRLRRNPAASIRLVGSANGNQDAGRKMAESVKNYMVNSFGIEAGRITVDASPMPAHKSGSGSSTGEDKKLIDAENYRVEIIATPNDLLKPVQIVSIQEEPIDNDVVLTLPSADNIDQWNVMVTDNTGKTMNYGPYRFTTVARIDSKELLGTRKEGRFTAKIEAKTKSGETQTLGQKEFRLVRDDSEGEQTGTRYSILFEFDESKTVQTYDQFLTETVAPNIPNGASVIIHGHTDVTGEPDYNAKLSQRRSDEAQKILTRELSKAGKKVTFDTYGFGEDERRSPFNNNLPEQRYYNRTVVVEVVPGR